MSKLGTKQTLQGAGNGNGFKGYVVDAKPSMAEITPRPAQTSKLNYKKSKDEPQGR